MPCQRPRASTGPRSPACKAGGAQLFPQSDSPSKEDISTIQTSTPRAVTGSPKAVFTVASGTWDMWLGPPKVSTLQRPFAIEIITSVDLILSCPHGTWHAGSRARPGLLTGCGIVPGERNQMVTLSLWLPSLHPLSVRDPQRVKGRRDCHRAFR